jgi:hypothetical protein
MSCREAIWALHTVYMIAGLHMAYLEYIYCCGAGRAAWLRPRGHNSGYDPQQQQRSPGTAQRPAMRALLRLVAAASSCAHVEPQANDMIRCSAAGDVPDSLHAAVAQAGLLSVKLLGAVGDGVADDSGAVQRAVQCVFYTGGAVFFPPGWYHFNRTVSLFEDPAPNFFGNRSMHGKGVVLRGSNSPRTGVNAAGVKMPPDVSFTLVPQTIISGPVEGPAFRIGAADTGASKLRIHGEVRMENLGIRGTEVAVTAFNAANLRFINCGFAAHHNTSE